MNLFLETIAVKSDGSVAQNLTRYTDELSAAIFYHSALNTNIRIVQTGEYKSFYANIHNESGVKIREERWVAPEAEENTTPTNP